MHRHLITISAAAALVFAAGLITTAGTTGAMAEAHKKSARPGPGARPVVRPSVRPGPAVVGPRRGPAVVGPRVVGPRVVGPRVVGPRVVAPVVVGPRRTYFARPLILGGRPYTVIRGPRSVFWRGTRRSLVPIAALTVLTVGGLAYAAYAYVPVEQPLCAGPTPDGCRLQWTEVPTPEGDLIPQCVAYCPQQ